uniref:Uncharacterized protein n=1 Tax=Meloidogyne incognita TaxID=6306 RepID=A0A914NP26_MELIC
MVQPISKNLTHSAVNRRLDIPQKVFRHSVNNFKVSHIIVNILSNLNWHHNISPTKTYMRTGKFFQEMLLVLKKFYVSIVERLVSFQLMQRVFALWQHSVHPNSLSFVRHSRPQAEYLQS